MAVLSVAVHSSCARSRVDTFGASIRRKQTTPHEITEFSAIPDSVEGLLEIGEYHTITFDVVAIKELFTVIPHAGKVIGFR